MGLRCIFVQAVDAALELDIAKRKLHLIETEALKGVSFPLSLHLRLPCEISSFHWGPSAANKPLYPAADTRR